MTQENKGGRTVLVTGATGGIGLVTARTLAAGGDRVVIVGRNPDKTAQVARDIGAHHAIMADLSEMSQVRRAAAEYRERYDRLDVLINNAGAMFEKRQETGEGIERTWALNHLAPFLLTRQLLSLLLVTPGARAITVASMAHRTARIRFDDPQFRRGYNAWAAYGQSKLANILFARELARRGAGAQSYSLHPGMVASGFGHNTPGRLDRLYGLVDRFAISPEEGAQTTLYLASTAEKLVNGGYYDKSRLSAPSARALDDGAAYRLWELSEAAVLSPDERLGQPAQIRSWPDIVREVRDLTEKNGP